MGERWEAPPTCRPKPCNSLALLPPGGRSDRKM